MQVAVNYWLNFHQNSCTKKQLMELKELRELIFLRPTAGHPPNQAVEHVLGVGVELGGGG